MPIESKVVDIAWRLTTALPRAAAWVLHAGWRDHQTLHYPLYGPNFVGITQGGSQHFYVHLGIAPSRKLRGAPRLPSPYRLRKSLDQMGLTEYPELPDHSSGEAIIFEVRGNDQAPIRRAEFWKTGLLAIQERLSVGDSRDDPTLDLLEIAEILHGVAAGVTNGAYARLLDARFPLLRRTDWFVAVTPSVAGSRGQEPWVELILPDEKPTVRAGDARPWVPASGYRVGSPRGARQKANPDLLLAQFTRELLQWCGYLDFEQSVASVVEGVGGTD